MLQAAGAVASEEEVFEELMTGDQESVTALIGAVLAAFSPSEGKPKNPDAQSANQSAPRAT